MIFELRLQYFAGAFVGAKYFGRKKVFFWMQILASGVEKVRSG
jgi:hypothetical protein